MFDLTRSEADGKDVVKKETFNQLLKATIPGKSEQYHKVVHLQIYTFKVICIPESFYTNISRQLFDYILMFVNSQN